MPSTRANAAGRSRTCRAASKDTRLGQRFAPPQHSRGIFSNAQIRSTTVLASCTRFGGAGLSLNSSWGFARRGRGDESPSLQAMTEWISVHARAAHRRVAVPDVWLAAVVAALLVLAGMGLLLVTAATWAWAPVGTIGP